MANESVQRFRREAKQIPLVDLLYMRATIVKEANKLAEDMRAAAPLGPTGNLRASIRVERGPNYEKNGQMIVRAGGPLTTKEVRSGSGVGYDYAMGTEFGTQKEVAEPFFFTTYRAKKREIAKHIYDSIPSARGITPWDQIQALTHSTRNEILGF